MQDFYRLRCPVCHGNYSNKDWVVLDAYNSVIHGVCYAEKVEILMKDYGKFDEIVERYDFSNALPTF